MKAAFKLGETSMKAVLDTYNIKLTDAQKKVKDTANGSAADIKKANEEFEKVQKEVTRLQEVKTDETNKRNDLIKAAKDKKQKAIDDLEKIPLTNKEALTIV
jgi:predicted transcriptional regulator